MMPSRLGLALFVVCLAASCTAPSRSVSTPTQGTDVAGLRREVDLLRSEIAAIRTSSQVLGEELRRLESSLSELNEALASEPRFSEPRENDSADAPPAEASEVAAEHEAIGGTGPTSLPQPSAAATHVDDSPLSGVWSGTFSNRLGRFSTTWTIAGPRSALRGTFEVSTGLATGRGVISGHVLENGQVEFEGRIPLGGYPSPYSECEQNARGTLAPAGSAITGELVVRHGRGCTPASVALVTSVTLHR